MSVPAMLEQNVKERMKTIIGEMIPEEMWDKLVKDNIDEFCKVDLPRLIKSALAEQYKKIILDEFNKPEWITQYTLNGKQIGSDMVREIIKASAADILAGMIGIVCQNVLMDLQNKVQQYRY